MKEFKIELESLEELYEQDNFKLSKQGIINFFSNLKEMIDKFNALKNETLFILNECILAEINPGKACKNCKNSIEQMKKFEFFVPTFNNYIFSSTEMNYFVNTNRSVVNQLIEIEGYFSIFLDEFDNNVEDAQKLNIELKDFSFNSFEGESGNWNVKGYRKEDDVLRDSFFSTTGFFFQRGYNSDAFDDLIDGYSEGTRELGLLLYDQARIINSLTLLNTFIEELKDKILSNPLNFKSYKEENIKIKDLITSETYSFDSAKDIVCISIAESPRFYIESGYGTPVVKWSVVADSNKPLLSSDITCSFVSGSRYRGYFSSQENSIIFKGQNFTFTSEVNINYTSVEWTASSSDPCIQIIIKYVDQYKIESFD